MTLTFESENTDGSPLKFAGMWRPPHPPQVNGYVACSCGVVIQTMPQLVEHWQHGHFDRPLYEETA